DAGLPAKVRVAAATSPAIARPSLVFFMGNVYGMWHASRGRRLSPRFLSPLRNGPGGNCRNPSGGCLGDRSLPLGRLTLENLCLIYCNSLAKPALLLGQRDVLTGHVWRLAATILHREIVMLLRREMARVRAPGLPLLARGAAASQ